MDYGGDGELLKIAGLRFSFFPMAGVGYPAPYAGILEFWNFGIFSFWKFWNF